MNKKEFIKFNNIDQINKSLIYYSLNKKKENNQS